MITILFKNITFVFLICFSLSGFGQDSVQIIINADSVRNQVSPYIYGKNNSLSDSPGTPLTDFEWQRLIDAGITMFRENGGNNATKYNWRRKLSSHPDWYNNVYAHDWDYAAIRLQQHIPGVQGMWAFQLIGKAAKTTSYNFPDWNYNRAQWWDGVTQNLCGGGQVNSTGGNKALVDGNPNQYLENWPADSTIGILDHWFGTGGIGLDSTRIRYWNMDNEPEIWNGTHDDVMPTQPDAESFMQLYFDVAKKARARFPGIKLLGPVAANEWQWYNYNGGKIGYNGKEYTWLEYFILRIAEEQQRTGIRLLDVLDIHFYPTESSPTDILQLHRVYFDKTYNYPGANGVKKSGPGGWDATNTKEYVFARCSEWLEKYMGPNHGVTFGVSETGSNGDNPNVTALWYASTLGEFAKQGVEVFTPWSWKTGMFEVLHLFSRYGQKNFIASSSSHEEFVSVYPMANADNDSMTILLVNRSVNQSKKINIDLNRFNVKNGKYKGYLLSQLPQNESFISHTQNALKQSEYEVAFNKLHFVLEPLSIVAIQLVSSNEETKKVSFKLYGKNGNNVSALTQAGINIDGFSINTGSEGEANINLTTGNHGVTLSKTGYYPKNFQINIVTDTLITDTLQVKLFDVVFTVKNKETGLVVDSCNILANDQHKVTDVNGQSAFTNLTPAFSVTLSKKHFRDSLYTDIRISTDTNLVLYLDPVKYNIVFRVLDFYTGNGLWETPVTIDSKILNTDYSGNVVFGLPFGIHEYKIENPSYRLVLGNISISSDSSFIFYLSPIFANVKFRLKTGTAPVYQAEIKINETTLISNLIGIVNFFNLPTNSEYNYSIKKDGYENLSGNLFLRKDTTIDINMVETVTSVGGLSDFVFGIWPNPANDFLNLKLTSVPASAEISIYDIVGKVIKTLKIQTPGNLRIDINELPDGIYILQAKIKKSSYSKYFIKN